MNKFKMTTEGLVEAEQFLKDIGKDNFIKKGIIY